MNEDTEPNVYAFRAVHLPKFAAGMAELAKVAAKLAVEPMTYEVIERWTETEQMTVPSFDGMFEDRDWSGRKLPTYEVAYVRVRVNGTTPQLGGGWYFVGAIEHTDGGNLLHGDDPELANYRTADAKCEHCGYTRNRKKTVLLRNGDGDVTQVGSSCLKDFLGYHGDAARLVAMLEAVQDAAREDEDGCGYYSSENGAHTVLFLTAVAACVRVHGWTAKSAYRGIPTAELAMYVLGVRRVPSGRENEDLRQMVYAVEMTDADEAEAHAVIAWSRTIDAQTTNNYLGNVRVALGAEYVAVRHFGIAASAVSARRKEEENARAKEEADGIRAKSVHVGTVGKRETFTVSVLFVRAFETDYGTKYLVEMADEAGNVVKTFNTGTFGRNAAKGDAYIIKGTVKEHTEYNGTAQTMLARVALVQDLTEGR